MIKTMDVGREVARGADSGRSAFFPDDEPVLQGRPLLPGVEIPRFGRTDRWPFEAVRRPANVGPTGWVARFSGFPEEWNLRIREIVMATLNPQHPAVVAAGVDWARDAYEPNTVVGMLSEFRSLIVWADEDGLAPDPATWTSSDMHRYIAHKKASLSASTVRNYVRAVRALHQLSPCLTGGGLAADPWPGRTARAAAEAPANGELSTKNVPPETWFALVKAAWTYIDTYSGDILRARDRHLELAKEPTGPLEPLPEHLTEWLADPAARIPLHHSGSGPAGQPNWRLLGELMGRGNARNLFPKSHRRDTTARRIVLAAVAAGRTQPGSLIDGLAEITRPDGTTGPWHPGLDPWALAHECRALRAACYLFVAALSMIRDSEIREITRGSVVEEHYGAPAVVSRKRKLDPGRPLEHWWITEPVARAIVVAEELSHHPELVFADPGLPGDLKHGKTYEFSISRKLIERFIEHANDYRHRTGLPEIAEAKVAPHRFRKTMSMLVATQPGAEIALGLQLKHAATRALANRSTQGYAASDANWAHLLDSAIDSARFTRLRDLYDQHHAGQTIGYGPGADRLAATFDVVKKAADAAARTAKTGDKRTEYDLLRKTRVSLRFGKLNHCTFDQSDPAGAKCLKEAAVPAGHTGPLIDRCQPGRCHNSVITPDHLKIWRSEESSLLALLDTPKIAPCRREQLHQQLEDVRSVIRKADQ